MSRSKIKPIKQPDEASCGPASLKIALKMLGKYVSYPKLVSLCKTDHSGTSTRDFIRAVKKLGLSVRLVERATLRHITKILTKNNTLRVGIVSYMYAMKNYHQPNVNSGHFAVVASFSHSRNRIVLFDSYTGKRKSYTWPDFKRRWIDFEMKRRSVHSRSKNFMYIKKWQSRPLFVIAKSPDDLISD